MGCLRRRVPKCEMPDDGAIAAIQGFQPFSKITSKSYLSWHAGLNVVTQRFIEDVALRGGGLRQTADHETATLLGQWRHHFAGALLAAKPATGLHGPGDQRRENDGKGPDIFALLHQATVPLPRQSDGFGDPVITQSGAPDRAKENTSMLFDTGQQSEERGLQVQRVWRVQGEPLQSWDNPPGNGQSPLRGRPL